MTATRTAASETASGAATRILPSGGYTPRCRFRMALRTTDTRRPLTVMLCASVIILALDQRERLVGARVVLEHARDGLPHPPGLHDIAAPAVLQAGPHRLVDLQRERLVTVEV